jgi:hypothetical protein
MFKIKGIASYLAMTSTSCQAELVEALVSNGNKDKQHFDKLSVTITLVNNQQKISCGSLSKPAISYFNLDTIDEHNQGPCIRRYRISCINI